MAGEPDVVALAVAASESNDSARPCGVCRQVLIEHASRTGRDFLVLMAGCNGEPERARVHVLLPDGGVAMVWEPELAPGIALLKVKYFPRADGAGLCKAAHSFTEPLAYERQLHTLGWARPGPFGGTAAFAAVPELNRRLPTRPFDEVRDELPAELRRCLARAGVEESAVRVSGSRAMAMNRADSDWDLIVRVAPEAIRRLRQE
jgi:hypothetical protein